MTTAVPSSMQVTVERLGPGDWPAVRPLLRRHDPAVPEERWRSLFHHPWEGDDDLRGFALVHGGGVVGYCGVVPSIRLYDGRPHACRNLTTWVVEEGMGAHAPRLLSAAMDGDARTLLDLSPSADAARWIARWGFTPLETTIVVMPAIPAAGRRPGRRIWWTAEPSEILHVLRGEPRRLAADHLGIPGCGALVAGDGGGTCLVVHSRIAPTDTPPYAHLHHVGDPAFLARHRMALAAAIGRAAGVRFVAADARFLPARTPLAWRMPLEVPRALRSAGPGPREVDSLYSELILLGLGGVRGPVPDLREVRRRLPGRLPGARAEVAT